MQRIDSSFFYTLGQAIHPITELSGERARRSVLIMFIDARKHLEDALQSRWLRSAWHDGNVLSAAIEPFTSFDNPDEMIKSWEIWQIAEQAKKFEIALIAQLRIMGVYAITPKGGYDVDILTLNASWAFPPDLITLVPETEYDVQQAGLCLAFEVPTAAGFHLHRLNEAVIHKYWDAASHCKPRPKSPNLGVYLAAMEKDGIGDRKILATLKQIKDLHRNPTLHAQDNLSVQEAIELLGVIVSAISAMLVAIKPHQGSLPSPPTAPLLAQTT